MNEKFKKTASKGSQTLKLIVKHFQTTEDLAQLQKI